MRILIATGVYPPQSGGPAYYAKNLKEEFEKLGHEVTVRTFTLERALPTGVRHFVYFLKTLPAFFRADIVLVFDTFSVGFPVAVMQKLVRRNVILRVGGDFLWEQYVERTKEKIVLSKFYDEPRQLMFKERMILRATRFVLRTIPKVVFNTVFQKDLWMRAYDIPAVNVGVIENQFEPTQANDTTQGKTFVYAAAREIFLKNVPTARAAFEIARKSVADVKLEFLFDLPRDEALAKMRDAYACVLVSLTELSPNYILRALSFGKPVILTSENGIRDRVGDAAIYVNPLDPDAIARAVIEFCDPAVHAACAANAAALTYRHTYADIAQEFLTTAHV